MVHVKASMNLCKLADNMITAIEDCWKDPFDPPTVIFPDPMVEQWFKLYWLKKNTALLNLKFEKLDQFLFNTLQNDENAKILSSEMLRLAIIKKLSEEQYYKSLGEDVQGYLADNDGDGIDSTNWNRLYDYSKTIAELLLDYERTRTDWDDSTKADGTDTDSPWYCSEVKLYHDLFTDGILELNGVKYSTFNQLYKRSEGKFLDSPNRQPVFIFGFPGLGKAYIDALEELPASYNVIVYIQADSEEGFCNFGKHGTAFLNGWKDVELLDNDNPRNMDGNLIPKFVAAPSKVREIDKLHNEICKLLKNSGSPMLSDIKVFAPNIKDYIPAISLVFNQSVKQPDGYSGHIPYSISDYSAKTSNTYEAASILFRMFEKGYFNRADFIKLINNPVVQAARSITEDDVNNWKKWIMETNTYRNRLSRDDWKDAKERLLLAKLTDETVNELSPYDPIGSEDSTLYGFIDMIDTLEGWIGLREEGSELAVERLRNLLRDMLSLGKLDDKALKGERSIYLKMMGALSNLLAVFGEQFNYKIIFLIIMDSISGVSLSMSSEAKGIEFITFRPGRVIPAKYTFFIGMDSKAFPGTDKKNVLDLRKQLEDESVNESVVDRNKNALYCQMMATENEIRFSYVNKDLKKDEDFYRSSVLNEIAKNLGREKDSKENPIEERIGIDATWEIAFTNRNKRDNYIPSTSSDGATKKSVISAINTSEPPKKVSISQLRRFLEEPLKFQIETAFGYGDDDIEKEDTEFEPVYLDNLTLSNLRKKYIIENTQDEDIIKEIKTLIPDDSFFEAAKNLMITQVKNIRDSISKIMENRNGEIFYAKPDEVIIDDSIRIGGQIAFYCLDKQKKQLTVIDIKKYTNTKDHLKNTKYYLNSYVTALALMAGIDDTNPYEVILNLINPEKEDAINSMPFRCDSDEARTTLKKIYDSAFIDKLSVISPIEKIVEQYKKQMLKDHQKNDIKLDDLIDSVNGQGGAWYYFNKSRLTEIPDGLGYTLDDNSFRKEWEEIVSSRCKLIKKVLDDVEVKK